MKKGMEKLANVFSEAVEQHAIDNSVSLMEALIVVREDFGLDEDTIGQHVTDHLKQKLYLECQKSNLVKKSKSERNYSEIF